MSFNQLSDQLLLTILGKVALPERLQLRLVSPRWLGVIENFCLEQTSLKLFGSIDDVENYCQELNSVHHDDLDYWTLKHVGKDDDLVVDEEDFGEEMCDLLARLFVNVKHLIIYFRDRVLWVDVPYLLEKFSKLNSLSLCGRFEKEDDSDKDSDECDSDNDDEDDGNVTFESKQNLSSKILSKINSMTSLKRLDLLVDDFFSFTDSFRPRSIYSDKEYRKAVEITKVLAKLKLFSLNGGFYPSGYSCEDNNNGKPTELPWNCSRNEVLGSKCTHLRLANIPFGAWHNDEYGAVVSFDHIENLLFLQMKGIESSDEGPLLYQVSKVDSLQCLWLHFMDIVSVGDGAMFDDLSKLENLTELRFESDGLVVYDQDKFPMPDAKKRSSLRPPMESVKHISWFSFELASNKKEDKFDGKLFYKKMSAWFPNLEELCIYFDTVEPFIMGQLEANVDMLPHLSKHRFEETTQAEVNTEFTGRHKDFE